MTFVLHRVPELTPAPDSGARATAETPERLAAAVAADLERQLGAFADAAARVRGRSDEDAIHDLRVCARRLALALGVWRDLLRRRHRRRALRRMRELRRALGPARAIEVHFADLAARLPGEAPAVRVAAHELLERLRRGVLRNRRRAARDAAPRRIARIADRVRRAIRRLAPRAVALDDPLGVARRRLSAHAARAHAAIVEASERRDDPALHRARIEVKKWRYALESLAAAGMASPRRPAAADLKALQETLGMIHDRAELRDLVVREIERRRRSGHAPASAALATLAGALERERSERLEEFLAALPKLAAIEASAAEI